MQPIFLIPIGIALILFNLLFALKPNALQRKLIEWENRGSAGRTDCSDTEYHE